MTEQTEEPAPAVEEDVSDEQTSRAKELGWKSPDEWKGELPVGYIEDPGEYIDWATRHPAVKKLESEFSSFRRESQEQQRRIEAALTAQNERQRQTYEARIEELSQAKAKAKEEGDFETYVSLDEQEDKLRSAAPKEEAPKETISPEDKRTMDRWAAKNQWIRDPSHNERAAKLYEEAKGLYSDIEAVLIHVEEGMKPHLQKPEQPGPKVSGGLALGGGSKSGFSGLPQSAKDSFERIYSMGIYVGPDGKPMDKKEAQKKYAEDYENA